MQSFMQNNTETERLLCHLHVSVENFSRLNIGDRESILVPSGSDALIIYITQGQGWLAWRDRRCEIFSGMILVIPCSVDIIMTPKQCPEQSFSKAIEEKREDLLVDKIRSIEGLEVVSFAVSASLIPRMGFFDNLWEPLTLFGPGGWYDETFERILAELDSPGVGTNAIVDASMKLFLVTLLRKSIELGGSTSPLYAALADQRLTCAISAILSRPSDSHSVTSLAKLAGMNREGFVKKFTEKFGTTPSAFVQSVRIKSAATLLQTTTLPVKSVAMEVGFLSRSHFSRAFTKHYDQDPTTFRQHTRSASLG
jgi:AraC family transcriptional activator of mtrCDE